MNKSYTCENGIVKIKDCKNNTRIVDYFDNLDE